MSQGTGEGKGSTHGPSEALVEHRREQTPMHDALVPAHTPTNVHQEYGFLLIPARKHKRRDGELARPAERVG